MKMGSFIGLVLFGFLMLAERTSLCLTQEEAQKILNVSPGA